MKSKGLPLGGRGGRVQKKGRWEGRDNSWYGGVNSIPGKEEEWERRGSAEERRNTKKETKTTNTRKNPHKTRKERGRFPKKKRLQKSGIHKYSDRNTMQRVAALKGDC